MRMERLEQRRDIDIPDAEVLRVYYAMTTRMYGGGDTGAYEGDALANWRDPALTFMDSHGRPYTIDAYLRLNPFNHDELKAALALSGAKGIKVCLNLPQAWANVDPPLAWDVPDGQPLIGPWLPGSWGGHSLAARGYDAQGIYVIDTWGAPDRLVTWDACSAYCDEAHAYIDSMNGWKKKAQPRGIKLNLRQVTEAVNDVSSIRIGDKK
jgi:hypothetical protein